MKRMMNIWTRKATCRRCAAARHNRCELGYKAVFTSDEPTGVRAVGTPMEMCPKPMNNRDYFEAMRHYTRDKVAPAG